jgi:cell division protein FtsB
MNIYRRTVKLVNGVGHYTTYVCGRATKNNLNDTPKNVKADDLDALVLKLIQQHIAVYVDAKDRLKKLNRAPAVSGKRAKLQKKLADLEARQDKINNFIKNLYEDFADGVFTEDDYLEMKAGYLAELDAVSAEIGEVQRAIDLYAADYAGDEEMAVAFAKYIGVESISRELVTTFIKKITCYSKTRFEVEYTFGDELQELLELVEQRGADVG